MKLRIKKTSDLENAEKYNLLIDGVIDEKTTVHSNINSYHISTENDDLINSLKEWSSDKFIENSIDGFMYEIKKNHFFRKGILIFLDKGNSSEINISIDLNVEKWNKPYSISDYHDTIFALSKNLISIEDDKSHFYYQILIENKNTPIKNYIQKILENFNELEERAEKILIKNLNKESIITYFDFPKDYESACKQYLIYFIDFLRDLGIDTESTISTSSSQTVFSITPKDKKVALNNIKEALDIYLNLPVIDNISNINLKNDISINQLISNIHFLKSQLSLADAIIQSKEASIKSLNLTNYQLHQIINQKDKELKNSNSEDLVKGLVTIDKLESKGISINLAELFRRLKRKLK